jgi:hypothetical protein
MNQKGSVQIPMARQKGMQLMPGEIDQGYCQEALLSWICLISYSILLGSTFELLINHQSHPIMLIILGVSRMQR